MRNQVCTDYRRTATDAHHTMDLSIVIVSSEPLVLAIDLQPQHLFRFPLTPLV